MHEMLFTNFFPPVMYKRLSRCHNPLSVIGGSLSDFSRWLSFRIAFICIKEGTCQFSEKLVESLKVYP